MSTAAASKVPGFCGLCIARCGCIATVEHGRFTRLDPDPTHPTGQALCAKGRAAPELVYSKERLTRPLRRTRPKGEADPDWVEIFWDEALDATTAAMRRLAAAHGGRGCRVHLGRADDIGDRRFGAVCSSPDECPPSPTELDGAGAEIGHVLRRGA